MSPYFSAYFNEESGTCALTLVCSLIICILLYKSTDWLRAEIPLDHPADWIVVLGGESGQRVIGAAEAYHEGKAQHVFVSGSRDCELIARRLNMAGVPDVHYECMARNTYENALFTREALASSNPQRVLIITSWYHTRRALHAFEKNWQGVTFGIHGVYPGTQLSGRFMLYEAGSILAEYLKTAWYMLRYRIF